MCAVWFVGENVQFMFGIVLKISGGGGRDLTLTPFVPPFPNPVIEIVIARVITGFD